MDTVFLKLLSLSAWASVIALVVMVLRIILKPAPRWLICSLWGLVAIRLLCPFTLESAFSLMPQAPLPEVLIQEEIPPAAQHILPPVSEAEPEILPQEQPLPPVDTAVSPVKGAVTLPEVPQKQLSPIAVAEIIWAIGALSMLFYEGFSYWRLRRKVAVAVKLEKGIFKCDYIASPFVLGAFRPKIYLPSRMDALDKPYILAHEKAHIARLDPLWKALGFLLLALHWFNPILWAAFLLLCRDIESACDERVIRDMGEPAKVPYANALLNFSLPKALAYPLAFGEVGVKQRIKEVLNYKKPTLWISLAAVAALLITAMCFLTSKESPSLLSLGHIPLEQEVCLTGRKGSYTMAADWELSALEELLNTVSYDPKPLKGPLPGGEPGESSIDAGPNGQNHRLVFSKDFSAVGLGDETGIHTGYRVKNPEAAEAFFNLWADPFYNREVSGEALWAEDQPWNGTKNISREMLEFVRVSVSFHANGADSETASDAKEFYSSGLMNSACIDSLIQAIHQLQPGDFQPAGQASQSVYGLLTRSGATDTFCTTLSLLDKVNRKAILFRMEKDKTFLYITDDYETVQQEGLDQITYSTWIIKSPALIHFCQKFGEKPHMVIPEPGWKYDWQAPVAVEHEEAQIQMQVMEGWETEIIPYTDLKTPFGIRIRPEGEEGSLFFSFWPQGLYPDSSDAYWKEGLDSSGRPVTTVYPLDVKLLKEPIPDSLPWEYKVYRLEAGDYAIVNEDANHWLSDHLDEFQEMNHFCSFRDSSPMKDAASEDFEEFAQKYSEVSQRLSAFDSAEVFTHKGSFVLESEDAWNAVKEFMNSLSKEVTPAENPGDDILHSDITMKFFPSENQLTLCFTQDCQYIFLKDGDTIQEVYHLNKPELAEDFFAFWTGLVINQQVSGSPCWKENAPWVWAERLSADSIRNAYFPQPFHPMFQRQLDQLIPHVNSLTKKDFSPMEPVKTASSGMIPTASYHHFCVFLCDQVNSIAAAFVYKDGETELWVSEELSGIQDDPDYEATFSRWKIQDEELSKCLIQLNRHCPPLGLFAGWSHEWNQLEMENQNHGITLQVIDGWETETVPCSDAKTPWGIRCRPADETEGWLFFSFWPQGYHPQETDRYIEKRSNLKGFSDVRTSYPASFQDDSADPESGIWSYQLFRAGAGDYVILNEGADAWFMDYVSEIRETILRCCFQPDSSNS